MAAEPVQIPIDQLRRALDVALRHIEASAGPTVTLKEDLFWSVSADEQYSIDAEPQALTIGQLSESWQHLEDLLAHQDRAVGHHLVWLADVIRAIGQDIP
ncbi:hypothetical protein [Streptomyces beijiangensis]|uniref:Uncharacterized protein n=1 Tax=Streptomyces beijiangensis TaxID=163361 RepID=A0A939F8X9_9ACTN|nr:hypothetical protein [Streptomyces beijiangensis]MBO0513728.1 hypothetical protein [Streptomyces beijiangensis]